MWSDFTTQERWFVVIGLLITLTIYTLIGWAGIHFITKYW